MREREKKMFCDFFNQNLKASISWPGFAVRLSGCLSLSPSLSRGRTRETFAMCVWICFVLFSFRFAFALAFICCLLSICVCFAFLSFVFFFVFFCQYHKATIAVIIISSSSSAGCRALLGNPWMMIFPKLNQSEIESNLLSSSFCASDYATQISFARVP